jgi:hypothetical protein
VFWESPDQESFSEFSMSLRMFPTRMDMHLDPDQPEEGGDVSPFDIPY